MNTFVFISQFGNAIAAAAFDVSVFRFRSFSDFARQLSDDSSDFSFTRNTEVRRNVRVEDDGFRIFCTAGETAGTALALRKCFFYFADERIFFHGKFLISTCKDKAEDDTDANHDADSIHSYRCIIIHNLIHSFALNHTGEARKARDIIPATMKAIGVPFRAWGTAA